MKILTSLMMFFLLICNVASAVTCKLSDPFRDNTITLGGVFYAGADLPVGSVIYRTNVNSERVGITCDASFTFPLYYSVKNEPMGASFPQNGTPYTGNIYPTNVPGIGVALWWNGGTFTSSSPRQVGSMTIESTAGGTSYYQSRVFDISLIKTGPIASGAVVNGVSIPTVRYYADANGINGLPVDFWQVSFNGSIQLISQTCETPDVNVFLGDYEVTDFKGVGHTTSWVDSSIIMKNCPLFTGYYGHSNPQSVTGSNSPGGGTLKANMFKVGLQPATSMTGIRGVFKVDSMGVGEQAARGIGVQLGYSTIPNSSPLTPELIWEGEEWYVQAPNDGSAIVKLPLAARYYQTDDRVTPGPANAKIIFTIDYN